MKRWISSLLAAALCLSLLIAPAGAYVRVDTKKEVSLSLTYQYNNAGVKDLKISLYKVYDMSQAVTFTATEGFKNLGKFTSDIAYWTNPDDRQIRWDEMLSTLTTELNNQENTTRPDPILTETTDANGVVKFESKTGTDEEQEIKLTSGLYLVMGEPLTVGRSTYTPQAFLVALPYLITDSDSWDYDYDVDVSGKLDYHYDSPSSSTTITVVKKWEDEGADVERPDSIEVQLLHNGTLEETYTLNEANGWKHTWRGLSGSASGWTVTEADVPEGYSMMISRTGSTVTITNTAETELDDDDTPLGPGIDEGGDPGDLPDVDLGDDDVPLGNLPDTGILWWPVQLLTVAGIVLFSIGWLDLRRNKKRSNEE